MSTDDRHPSSSAAAVRRPRRAPQPGVFVLGLVGPAGAGKSTIARALAAQGARVVDADRLGHEVTDHDPEVRAALIADYGPSVYTATGALDRAQVAARVFAEPEALARLNALVHPRILTRFRDAIADASRPGGPAVLVIDAALLLDWGFESECDAVLAVLAPEAQQLARLTATRGWSEAEARRRLAAARAPESFAALADAVVMNDGDEASAIADAQRRLAHWREGRA
jgi:dephospho-CoA kinase